MSDLNPDDIVRSAADASPAFAAAVSAPPLDWLRLVSLAAEGLSDPEPDWVERQIAFYAYLVGRAAQGSSSPRRRLDAMRQVLFQEEGLKGNENEYHDPRNSYLAQVLRRGLGLPITLGAVCMAVAELLDWPLIGIDFPGHFLLRYQQADEWLIIDPFNGGELVDIERCLALAAPFAPDLPEAQVRLLARLRLDEPIAPRRLVERVLKNLETQFIDRQEFDAAKNIIQKLLLLTPSSADELRDLGSICHLLGEYDTALVCLRGYLGHQPHPAERKRIEAIIARLEELSAGS